MQDEQVSRSAVWGWLGWPGEDKPKALVKPTSWRAARCLGSKGHDVDVPGRPSVKNGGHHCSSYALTSLGASNGEPANVMGSAVPAEQRRADHVVS